MNEAERRSPNTKSIGRYPNQKLSVSLPALRTPTALSPPGAAALNHENRNGQQSPE